MGIRRKSKFLRRLFAAIFITILSGFSITAIIQANNKTSALAEVSSDVWNLSLSFYDSTVDNGNTELTQQTWSVPVDQTYSGARTFTIQTNYSANIVDKTYNPKELQIKLELPIRPGYSTRRQYTTTNALGQEWTDSAFLWLDSYNVSAKPLNGTSTIDYDWEYECPSGQNYCLFRNLKPIEKDDSLQGSFQVTLQFHINGGVNGAPFFEETFHEELAYEGVATLNNTVRSNPINIHLSKDTAVEWKKRNYIVKTAPRKLDSLDGFNVANANDYTWVHYVYYGASVNKKTDTQTTAPYEAPYTPETGPENYVYAQRNHYIPIKDWRWEDTFSDDALVFNSDKQPMTKNNEGNYIISSSPAKTTSYCRITNNSSVYVFNTCYEIYVAFPKDKFNETLGIDKVKVKNTVYSRGTYFLSDQEELLDENSAEIDLRNFALSYEGNSVSISKALNTANAYGNINYATYQSLRTKAGASFYYDIHVSALNLGSEPYDLVIGDDIAFYQDRTTGAVTKFNDDEHSFTRIRAPYELVAANGEDFTCANYDVEVYYRLGGESDYRRLDVTGNHAHPCGRWIEGIYTMQPTWNLPDNSVAWKIVIKNLDKGIADYPIFTVANYHSQNVPQYGELYNFSYAEVQRNGQTLNVVPFESYASELTQENLAPYDQATYGHYQQRAFHEYSYDIRPVAPILNVATGGPSLDSQSIAYNASTDGYEGMLKDNAYITQQSSDKELNFDVLRQDLTEADLTTEWTQYILLPPGVTVASTPEEIANSASAEPTFEYLYNLDGTRVFNTKFALRDYVKTHTQVSVIKNWRNSGQELIRTHIDFSEKPFFAHLANYSGSISSFNIKIRIPYDVYAENEATDPGHKYPLKTVVANDDSYKLGTTNIIWSPTPDDGTFFGNAAYADVDEDESTEDIFYTRDDDFSILTAVAAEQSIKATTQTDQNNTYTTEDSYATAGSEYYHKLAIRTGNSKATNVVVYDVIEAAFGNNEHWQGEFLGIDTSYVETQNDANGNPIHIKTYYSPNTNPGSLTSDNSWQEYIEGTTDPSLVKSIAFKYVDANGDPTTVPANSYVYTLLRMKAPADNPSTAFAYNNFRTEWNAIDQNSGMPVPQIEGISSNTTRVQIDHLFDIHVVKQWDDFNNKYNTRPSTITPKLTRDIETIDHSSSINIANGESTLDYHNLHEYYRDQYDVTLDSIPLYTTTRSYDSDTLTYTFKSVLNTDKIKVVNIWNDKDNAYGMRPGTVDYNLVYNNATDSTHQLNVTGNTDNFDFEGIPAHLIKQHSVALKQNVPNYTTTLEVSEDGKTYTFTHTLTATFDITVKHIWIDNNNINNLRPASVEYTLTKEEETDNTLTISAATNGQDKFASLPLLDEEKYSVNDVVIPHYTTTKAYDQSTHTYTFTSTLSDTFDINVEHVWIDNNNAYGYRPDSVEYTLKKEQATEATLTLDNTDASDSFTGLLLLDESKYSVPDVTVPHYTTTKAYDSTTHTYTFTHTLSEQFKITIKHEWKNDENNARNLRPSSVDYTIKETGATDHTLTLDAIDTQNELANLDLLDYDKYSVNTNVTVDHYRLDSATCETPANTHDLVCTFVYSLEDNLDIHVKHIWVDNNNAYGYRPSSLDYELQKSNATDQTKTSSANWTADFVNLHAPDEAEYSVADVTVPHYTTTKTYDSTTHTYTFESTLSDKFNIIIKHEWRNDNNNARNLRPSSVDYTIKETGVADHTLTLAATNTQNSITDLNLLDAAKYSVPIDVTVDHYHLDSATCTTDQTTHNQTCTFIYSLEDNLDIHVQHIWIDNNNAYGYRPSSLDYELTKSGTTDQTKTSSANWTADFVNLHAPDEAQYSVSDVTVPHYTTTKDYDQSTHTYTFTSTLSDTFNFTVKHIWIDEDNVRDLRPAGVEYTLTKSNTTADTKTLAATNAEDSFTNLNLLDENLYAVSDVTVPHYATEKSCEVTAGTHNHVCTFTHTLEDNLDIHVVHLWDDSDNAYNTRPTNLDYELTKSGATDQTKTSSANWTADFVNLHAPDKASYSVVTPTITDYETTLENFDESTMTYTFKSVLTKTFDVIVNHVWQNDENNVRNLRPTSIAHNLQKDSATTATQNATPNSWTTTFARLPLNDRTKYSIPDISVEHYSTSKNCTDGENFSIVCTFTHTLEDNLDIHVKHIWIDRDNAYGYRPASVSYELQKSSATDQTKTSSADWTADFVNLHAPDEAEYSVADVTVEHYTTTKEYDPTTHTYTFTSTLSDKFSITVKHVWIDENNVRNLRPAEGVTYRLVKNRGTGNTMTLGPIEAQDTFDELDLIDEPYYNVPDVTVEHYATTKEYNAATRTYTFTHTLEDDLDIHVQHIWDDEDDRYGFRPTSVTYTLTKDDAENATQDSSDNWTADFINLHSPDKDAYAVKDVDVENYTTTKSFDPDTMTYTFTSTLITEPITVVHIWDDDGNSDNTRPESIHFDLLHSDEKDKELEFDTEDDEAESQFEKIPSSVIDEFSVEITPIPHYTTSVEYDEATHTYTFVSVLTKIDITVNNIWEDNNDEQGIRPDKLEFILLLNGTEIDRRTIGITENSDSFNFEDLLDYLRAGYTVELVNSPEGYTTTVEYDAENLTYTFTHKLIPTPASNLNSAVNTPFTGDQISEYLVILAICAILGLCATGYIIRRVRKHNK